MPAPASRLESRLLATAAMGLALAVIASYREAEAADICVGGGLTTINTAENPADSCSLDADESVDVEAGGSIPHTGADDAIFVPIGAAAGYVDNAGTVSSATQAVELRIASSLSGGITNSGTLTSTGSSAIQLLGGATITSGIQNSGAIDGGTDAIVLSGATTSVAGGLSNNSGATIDAGGDGVEINNTASVTSGGLTNAGTITAIDDGIDILNQSSITGGITNAAGGLIDSDDNGVSLDNGTVSGGIDNGGTIDAGASAIFVDNSSSVTSNGITNSSTGDIDAVGFGIIISSTSTVTGGITNQGDITSTGNDGIGLIGGGTEVAGGITNTSGATIDASDDGVSIANSASVTSGGFSNSGLIDADDDGVLLENGTITGNLVNAGTIDADGDGIFVDTSSSITGSIQNSGSITGGTNGIHVDDSGVGGIINAASATITGGTFSILIAGPDAPITVTNAGTLVGEVQLNNGTLDLKGSSSRVDGVISGLASSTVNVNGDFTTEGDVDVGTLTVASSAELTLDNDVDVDSGFSNAGTVAIADGATRAVTGDYTQTGDGTLQIGATSDSSFGKLTVSGTADLSASDALHVTVSAGETFTPGDELLDVVQAGTLTASSITVTDTSALLGFSGTVDGNTVDLQVTSSRSIETVVTGGGSGGNGGGAGGALDDINADGPSGDMQTIVNALNTLSTDQEVKNAVEKLLPAITGGHAQGNVAVAKAGATDVVQDRLIRFTGLNAGGALLKDPVAWVKPFAADTAQGSRGGVSGFDGLTVGTAIGVDGRFTEDLRAGVALSYANAKIDGRGVSDSRVDIDTVQITGYGSYDIDRKTHLNLLGGIGWNGNDSRRVVDFGTLDRTADADYDSWHVITEVELVRSYRLSGDLGLMPSVGASYTYANAEDYSESGAGAANLDVDDADADSLTLMTSAKLIYGLTDGIDLTGNLGLTYDVLAGDDQVTATFQGGGSSFVTESIDPAPFGVTTGFALELVPETGIDASLAYDIEAREDFRNHKVQLNLRFPF